jgi:hypothetical protein
VEHPNYFPNPDLSEELKYFYDAYFDYKVDEETVDNILSGQGICSAGTGSSKE